MYEDRLRKLEKDSGSSKDMIYVSWCLIHGDETMQDVKSGIEWLVKAAKLGDAEAHIRLAKYFEDGLHLEQDCMQAMYWYEEAQKIESIYGPYALALAYNFGSPCISRDELKALDNFALAAARGHLISKAQLARIYRSGRFGLVNKIFGYWLPVDIALRSVRQILRRDMNEAFWDYERWLPKTARFSSLIKNTYFDRESNSKGSDPN